MRAVAGKFRARAGCVEMRSDRYAQLKNGVAFLPLIPDHAAACGRAWNKPSHAALGGCCLGAGSHPIFYFASASQPPRPPSGAYEQGKVMAAAWSAWKRFPDAKSGEHIEAPIGAGVYEVRRAASGELIAFGHAGSVVQALAGIRMPRSWTSIFSGAAARTDELEYRVCGASDKASARHIADGLRNRRHAYWTRRLNGSAA
jgi:hypothetical protein